MKHSQFKGLPGALEWGLKAPKSGPGGSLIYIFHDMMFLMIHKLWTLGGLKTLFKRSGELLTYKSDDEMFSNEFPYYLD